MIMNNNIDFGLVGLSAGRFAGLSQAYKTGHNALMTLDSPLLGIVTAAKQFTNDKGALILSALAQTGRDVVGAASEPVEKALPTIVRDMVVGIRSKLNGATPKPR